MQAKSAFILVLLFCFRSAHAGWIEIDVYDPDAESVELESSSGRDWSSRVFIVANGGETEAEGRARCRLRRESVSHTGNVPTGIHFRLWRHFPPGVGEVEVRAKARYRAFAESRSPGLAKAAVLGYARAEYWLDGLHEAATARASAAVANTKVEGLPDLTLGVTLGVPAVGSALASLKVPVTWNDGGGQVRDSMRDYIANVRCPVSQFRIRETSQSRVFVWARGARGRLPGRAFCDAEGKASVVYDLLTHGRCPGR